MKFFLSFNRLTKTNKYIAAFAILVVGLLGWSSRVYSPAHIGHYAIPIPRLIPLVSRSDDQSNNGTNNVAGLTPAPQPGSSSVNTPLVFKHTNIITTYFWVGEPADGDNGHISNVQSAWDEQWETHYGGVDSPSPRNGYNPAAFTPKENPFYFALPYNDIASSGKRKSTAANCPLASQKINYSWCKNGWIAIRHGGRVAYAQWEDVGPFGEDDTSYVFGTSAPSNKQDAQAGLDVSPAIRDYFGLQDVDKADWTFIDSSNVPAGPWKNIVTTSLGTSVN